MSRNLPKRCLTCGVVQRYGPRCEQCSTARHRESYGNGWQDICKRVLDRDGHRCQLRLPGCTETATTVDHVRPVIAGGDRSMDNLQAACAHCNSSKQDRH